MSTNLSEKTKQELLENMNQAVVDFSQAELDELVREFIRESGIATFGTVKVRIQYGERYKCLSVNDLRMEFEKWMDANHPQQAAKDWVKKVSRKRLGISFGNAGLQKKRFCDGYRYMCTRPIGAKW